MLLSSANSKHHRPRISCVPSHDSRLFFFFSFLLLLPYRSLALAPGCPGGGGSREVHGPDQHEESRSRAALCPTGEGERDMCEFLIRPRRLLDVCIPSPHTARHQDHDDRRGQPAVVRPGSGKTDCRAASGQIDGCSAALLLCVLLRPFASFCVRLFTSWTSPPQSSTGQHRNRLFVCACNWWMPQRICLLCMPTLAIWASSTLCMERWVWVSGILMCAFCTSLFRARSQPRDM